MISFTSVATPTDKGVKAETTLSQYNVEKTVIVTETTYEVVMNIKGTTTTVCHHDVRSLDSGTGDVSINRTTCYRNNDGTYTRETVLLLNGSVVSGPTSTNGLSSCSCF